MKLALAGLAVLTCLYAAGLGGFWWAVVRGTPRVVRLPR